MTTDIRLQFVTERGLCAALIRWLTGGDISHVDAVMPGRSEWLIGSRLDRRGGMPSGVGIRPRAYRDFTRVVRATIEVEPEQAGKFYAFLDAQMGKPYDWRTVVALAAGRDWRDDGAWACAELIARGLEVAGVFGGPLYLAANKIAPVPLALALSALPNVRFESY